jgi:hypothetical protein
LQETVGKATTPLQLWERTLEHPIALLRAAAVCAG